MKTVFDQATRDELIARIKLLNENCRPLWGKMTPYQMTRHCTIWNEWVLGKSDKVYKQGLLGKIFGKLALRSNTKDNKPLGRNMPAGRGFIVREKTGDLNKEKSIWVTLINDYGNFSSDGFVHDFFGKMSKEQIGIFTYKHTDHHLRQFGI